MQKKKGIPFTFVVRLCKETTQGNSSRPAFSPPAILFHSAGVSLASPQLHSFLVSPPDECMSTKQNTDDSLYRKRLLGNGDDGGGGGDGGGPL